MSAPPYMKLFIADYLADTQHLGTMEHGAYLLILMAMWRAGGKLPRNDEKLAKITRCTPKEWAAIKPTILALFTVRGGSVSHKRVRAELERFCAAVEARKTAINGTDSENGNENSGVGRPKRPRKNVKKGHNQISDSEDTNVSSFSASARRIAEGYPDEAAIEAARGWVKARGVTLDVAVQARRFRSHALAQARQVADWPAAWEGWVQNACDDAPVAAQPANETPLHPPFPASDLRAVLVEKLGEPWVRSWLDPCRWVASPPTIVPQFELQGERIQRDAADTLAEFGVAIGEPARGVA